MSNGLHEDPSPERPNGTKGPGWTKEGGDHLERLDRMLVDMLGNKYAKFLTDRAKKLTYGDVLMLHSWYPPGRDPETEPGGSDEFEALTAKDVRSVAEAIEQKTGRKYPEGVSYGSCSCVP